MKKWGTTLYLVAWPRREPGYDACKFTGVVRHGFRGRQWSRLTFRATCDGDIQSTLNGENGHNIPTVRVFGFVRSLGRSQAFVQPLPTPAGYLTGLTYVYRL